MVRRPAPGSWRARLGQHPVLGFSLPLQRTGCHAGELTDRDLGERRGGDGVAFPGPDVEPQHYRPISVLGQLDPDGPGERGVYQFDLGAEVRELSLGDIHTDSLAQMPSDIRATGHEDIRTLVTW